MEAIPNYEEWLADSNEALNIALLAPSKDGLRSVASFHPKFTYPIFGDDEKIFGYKDLKLKLRYRANDMRPHFKLTHSKKYKPDAEIEPTNVAEILQEGNHLPKVAFASANDFEDSSRQLGDDWTPPGKLHSTVETADGTYEIWRGNLADPAVKQLNNRVQIFVPLFIEGGSYIGQRPESDTGELDLSDADRWTLFFLYRKQPSLEDPEKHAYTFVGFSTVYRFYYFQSPTPPSSPAKNGWELPNGDLDLGELPCRTRLSQFVILPPFQGKGVGGHLYKSIFDHYFQHSQTRDFTVEDPNEAFDDLRDRCDLAFLRTIPEFEKLHIDTSVKLPKSGPVPQLIVGGKSLETIRQKSKIAPRQFGRVLEMHLMSQLPASVRPTMEAPSSISKPSAEDTHQAKLWRLVVKQRLYRHNKDILSQMDVSERIDKLQETIGSVELEYARLLEAYEKAKRYAQPGALAMHGKRRLEVDAGESSSKRAKTEEIAE